MGHNILAFRNITTVYCQMYAMVCTLWLCTHTVQYGGERNSSLHTRQWSVNTRIVWTFKLREKTHKEFQFNLAQWNAYEKAFRSMSYEMHLRTFELKLGMLEYTPIKNRSFTKFYIKIAINSSIVNKLSFVSCVIELFTAVGDSVSCVFEGTRAHTHSHALYIQNSPSRYSFFRYFTAWNAVVTNVVRMKWNQMI